MRSKFLCLHLMVAVLACGIHGSGLVAAPLYQATKTNAMFKATTSTNGNTNNLASEGGLGKQYAGGGDFYYVIDDIDNGIDDGLLPDKLKYVFTLSNAEKDAILNNDGVGKITVVAARDLGRLINPDAPGGYDPGTEYISALIDDEMVAGVTLFKETLSTSMTTPPHSEGAADLTKGPNFNTDVTATDSGMITKAIMQAAADDNSIELLLDPTDKIARLKIKSITLEYNAVPEPLSVNLLGLGGLLAALSIRTRGLSTNVT